MSIFLSDFQGFHELDPQSFRPLKQLGFSGFEGRIHCLTHEREERHDFPIRLLAANGMIDREKFYSESIATLESCVLNLEKALKRAKGSLEEEALGNPRLEELLTALKAALSVINGDEFLYPLSHSLADPAQPLTPNRFKE